MKKRDQIHLIFPIIFIFLGCIPLLQTAQLLFKAKAAESWPTTEGRITQSTVQTTETGMTWHFPDVRCEYTVNGKTYTNVQKRDSGKENGKVALANIHFLSIENAQKVANRYKPGQTVTVYYPPDNPAGGILEPGTWTVSPGMILWSILGIVCIGIGLRTLAERRRGNLQAGWEPEQPE